MATGALIARPIRLAGRDPYSASKAACELAVRSFAESYFGSAGVPVATARAGNVVGGGDWSADRLIPDLWRAHRAGKMPELRYPHATRPWQHVLDPLSGYFRYIETMVAGRPVPPALNFGPRIAAAKVSVSQIAERVAARQNATPAWRPQPGDHPYESPVLSLDPALAEESLDWRAQLDSDAALDWTVDWYRRYDEGDDAGVLTLNQIAQYEAQA